jgi:hypothetical protein
VYVCQKTTDQYVGVLERKGSFGGDQCSGIVARVHLCMGEEQPALRVVWVKCQRALEGRNGGGPFAPSGSALSRLSLLQGFLLQSGGFHGRDFA